MLEKFKLNSTQAVNTPHIQQEPLGKNIPKVVYQTYVTKNLPPELTENISKLQSENPSWDFRLYDNNDQIEFIKTYYPNLLDIYMSIDESYGAARADLFRYLIIYKFGGVYLDIKSSLAQPIDEIVDSKTQYILTHWKEKSDGNHAEIANKNGEYQQWHIISVAGHPFLWAVINAVCNNVQNYNPFLHGKSTYATLRVTGPIAYSLAIEKIVSDWPHTCGYDFEFGLIYSIYNSSMKSNLTHRKNFKNHYASSTMPMIKQKYIIELIYTQTWRVIWKASKLWKALTNRWFIKS